MFERKEAVTDAVNKAYEAALSFGRGDTLAMEFLESVTGLTRYGEFWSAFIQRFSKRLFNERRIAILSERAVGYRLLTKQEQLTAYAEHRRKKAMRQTTRAIRAVETLAPGELSDHQRRIQAMQSESLRSERRQIKRGLKHQRLQGRVTQTNPRRTAEVA